MSSLESNSGPGLYRKPRANVYTMLLILALLALLLGILCLYLEMSAYEFEFKGAPGPSTALLQTSVPVPLAATVPSGLASRWDSRPGPLSG